MHNPHPRKDRLIYVRMTALLHPGFAVVGCWFVLTFRTLNTFSEQKSLVSDFVFTETRVPKA